MHSSLHSSCHPLFDLSCHTQHMLYCYAFTFRLVIKHRYSEYSAIFFQATPSLMLQVSSTLSQKHKRTSSDQIFVLSCLVLKIGFRGLRGDGKGACISIVSFCSILWLPMVDKRGAFWVTFLLLASPVGLFDDVYDGPISGFMACQPRGTILTLVDGAVSQYGRCLLVMPLFLFSGIAFRRWNWKGAMSIGPKRKRNYLVRAKYDLNSPCIEHHYLFSVETSLNVSHVAETPSMSNWPH